VYRTTEGHPISVSWGRANRDRTIERVMSIKEGVVKSLNGTCAHLASKANLRRAEIDRNLKGTAEPTRKPDMQQTKVEQDRQNRDTESGDRTGDRCRLVHRTDRRIQKLYRANEG
jgi:hypothetical protein